MREPECDQGCCVLCARLLAMLLACVAFSVAVDSAVDGELVAEEPMAKWSIFSWGLSFFGSALLFLAELCGLQSRLPVSWGDLTVTFASYAALLCLTNAIIFGVHFVKGFAGHSYSAHVTSLVFSVFATAAYLMEVIRTRQQIRQGQSRSAPDETGFMATGAGLLKVCETFVASVIFVFLSEPNAYESHAAIRWCMAVYCVCFILSSMVILLRIGKHTTSSSCLLIYDLLAAMTYQTATIIWPIYKFDKHHAGNPTRPIECSSSQELCPFDKLVVVAVLTSVNFLLYLADVII